MNDKEKMDRCNKSLIEINDIDNLRCKVYATWVKNCKSCPCNIPKYDEVL